LIKIAVTGAMGKMGKEVIKMVQKTPDFSLCAGIDKMYKTRNDDIKMYNDVKTALRENEADIIVDFTQPDSVYENINLYLDNKIKSVIGTTGLKGDEIKKIEEKSKANGTGIIIAPNFSLGAVLMMKFAATASKYFSNAEIIEYHHNGKKDAPSGTSIKTAQLMIKNNDNFKLGNCEEKETIKGARGGNFEEYGKGNIQIHAIRMPGFVASQEVIFGSDGQTLKIHHDTINRECYMSGVELAIRHLAQHNDFIYGLEAIL